LKASHHFAESEADMPGYVLEEAPNRSNCGNDSLNMGPKVPLVFHASPLAGAGERRTGVATNDAIHASTPLLASKGLEIRPHRRIIQDPGVHRLNQYRDREGFDLHITDRSSRGNSQLDSEIKPSVSRAEAEDVLSSIPGT
jgi:hypothetical protein